LDFCAVAHESRYQWATRRFDLAGKTVLDLGCGSGYGTKILGAVCGEARGVDRSQTAIDFANMHYAGGNTRFDVGDVCGPNLLAGQAFDFVFSFDVIEHLERYFDFLLNAVRLLRTDGTFILGCPNRLQTFAWNRTWNPYHFQEFSPRQFRRLLPLYFGDVRLVGQDFSDPLKRQSARRQNRGPEPHFFKSSLRGLVPGSLLPILRRCRTLLSRGRTVGAAFRVDDVSFFEEPGDSVLDSCFGIIAICSAPREPCAFD
jgi:SAM-dependent methyltransferase